MGIGIGIVLGTLFMMGYKYSINLTKEQIETKARDLGMEYPSEFKVINKEQKEVKDSD